MIDAVQRGEVDVIVSYSNSRLTRRPRELEDLIDLHSATGVEISTVVSGNDDLSTADGRMVARIKANVDAAEAERTSERVKRAARGRREAGLFHGGIPPFGYVRDDDGSLVIHAERAAILREAAGRILRGETLYGVMRDLNRRGVRTGPSSKTPDGAVWHNRTLKRVLTFPSAVGCVAQPDGTLREVAPPILGRDDWQRIREILGDPGRSPAPDHSNKRRYPLSGVLVCGHCEHKLTGASRKQVSDGARLKVMACKDCNKTRIDYAPVEMWVKAMLFHRLDVDDINAALAPNADDTGEADELRAAITADNGRLERLQDEYDDDEIDKPTYNRRSARITARRDANRDRLAQIAKPSFTIDTGGMSLPQAWDAHGPEWQRTLIDHVIERVVIGPLPPGMATTVTRFKAETDDAFTARRHAQRETILSSRVRVEWRV